VIDYSNSAFPSGIPGMESHADNIAMEAITYIPLEAGTYAMVVNSDDGFRVTVGNVYDRLEELTLGEFDGGRGSASAVFSFEIAKDGVYGFRLIYEQGGGGYNVSWYSADPANPDDRYLLNEDLGIPCYRALRPGALSLGPTIRGVYPLPNSENVPPSQEVSLLIEDHDAAFDPSTFHLIRNGEDVTADAVIDPKEGGQTRIHYTPTKLSDPLSVEEYKISYADPTRDGGVREAAWNFQIAPYANFTLPEPIWFEDFESTPEGSAPAGWSTWSPMEPTGNENLDDPTSDSCRI